MNVLSKNSKLLYSGRDEKRNKEEKTAIIEKKNYVNRVITLKSNKV